MSMEHPDPVTAELQTLVSNFAAIDRNHRTPETGRHENDAEHTYSVAMLAWYFYEQSEATNLDLGRIHRYALVHDLLEAISEAGDVNSFASPDERAAKEVAEDAALVEFAEQFQQFPGMVEAAQRYHAQVDEEAVFVWTVDKLQALIHDDRADWIAHESYGVGYERFLEKYEGYRGRISPYLESIYESWLEYSKTVFWDQPDTTQA